jgi:3-oxoacyl-[acyl-carrier-protein] synthase III
VALRHLRPIDRLEVLGALGVGPEQSTPLDLWGCHGTNDVILSMELGQQSGAIRDHSLVLLLSGGIGFTYASAAIRWGPA